MAYAKKSISGGGGVASLFREAGNEAKLRATQIIEQVNSTGLDVLSGEVVVRPNQPRIFSVLEYIESSWGLNMPLYPVQRFLVKLYYHLPLDNKTKNIEVTDMLKTRVLHNFTETEYLRFLYEEGRCNIGEQDHERRELVLAIGRRGGKCLSKGSVILTHEGLREIQELGDSSGPEYQPLGVQVAQEGTRRAISAFFYNGGMRDTLRIRSRCGYEVEGTPNHRVKVMDEAGTIEWRFLSDLRVGDRLGIHRRTDLWASLPVDLTPYFSNLPGTKQLSLPKVIDDAWGELLGVLVGDGTWVRTGGLEVTVGPYPEWLVQVQELFRKTLGEPRTNLERKTGRAHRVVFHSVAARLFFDRLGFNVDVKSSTKRVPWIIMRSPRSVVAAFLRGLFETDGGTESGGRKVSFSTASPKLASEVQLLLLNFGILSRVKPRWNKKFKQWYQYLQVLGAESIRTFASEIGFISERKKSLFQAHLSKGDLGNKSETEAIPFQKEWCRRLVASVPKNNGNKYCGKLGWRRSTLRVALGNVIKNTLEDLSYPRLRVALQVAREAGADPNVISHFEEIVEAGYYFDTVTEVTPSKGLVYDLTVPDGESFVANGMTNHNTTLAGIFASYEVYRLLNLYHPQGYYGLPPGNRIQIISVATDKDQAGLLFNEVTSHLARCDYFKPYIASNTQSDIKFRTPNDIDKFGDISRFHDGKFQSLNGKATLRVTFKSCVAKGLRGSGNVVVILDEMAHFQDQGQSSAKDIYDAVTPSTAAFSPKDPDDSTKPIGPVEARIIAISSPLNKAGKFYDLYHLAMSKGPGSSNLLAIQAPTWEINPTIAPSYYQQKYHADPTVFMTEHGAQFSDRVRGWIEREQDLLACIDPLHKPLQVGPPRVPHQIGIDIGLVAGGDSTAFVITYVDDGRVVLAYHERWEAGKDWRESNPHLTDYSCDYVRKIGGVDRLDFDEIADRIVQLTKRFYITDGLFDRWNGIPLEQALIKRGLKNFQSAFFTRDATSKMYQSAKMLMFDKKLVMYDYPTPTVEMKHSPLIAELLTLQAEQFSRNIVIVSAPEQKDCHDDMSDAFVRAVWLSQERLTNIKTTYGSTRGDRPSTGMSQAALGRYQMKRAKAHGGYGTERILPKGMRRGR